MFETLEAEQEIPSYVMAAEANYLQIARGWLVECHS
jgi:hypothetical protein